VSQSPTQTNERFPTRRPKTHTASIGFVIGQNIRDGAKPPHVPLPSRWRDLPVCISGPALRIYLQHCSPSCLVLRSIRARKRGGLVRIRLFTLPAPASSPEDAPAAHLNSGYALNSVDLVDLDDGHTRRRALAFDLHCIAAGLKVQHERRVEAAGLQSERPGLI